jgi:hypothetical protein
VKAPRLSGGFFILPILGKSGIKFNLFVIKFRHFYTNNKNDEIEYVQIFRTSNIDVLNENDIVVVLKSDVNPNLYFSKFLKNDAWSYSFTASDLSVFPPNEEVRIYLARGKEEPYTQGSRTMAIRIGNLITCPSMTIR